jgi:hypothetical protein
MLPYLLAYYHYSSHAGYNILLKLIQYDFYSPLLSYHARKFTAACHICNHMKPSLSPSHQLSSTPLPKGKAQEWIMDLVTGLPSHDGYDSFLSIIDPWSGFRLAFPCKTTITAKSVVQILQLYVIQIFGIPTRFSSDGGPNLLVAKDFTTFLAFHNIERKVGLPYSPKSGKVTTIH